MALTATEIESGADLLRNAISNPFFRRGDHDTPIQRWFSFLAERLRLASFQTGAYLQLGNTDLPTTAPLALILQSVLEDEGWQGWHFAGGPDTPFALVHNLTARRRQIGGGHRTRFWSSCLGGGMMTACHASKGRTISRRSPNLSRYSMRESAANWLEGSKPEI